MQARWEQRLLALAGEAPHPNYRPIQGADSADPTLWSAYRECALVTSAHSKSFSLASGLLPEPKRHAVRALYAFCRTVDDIVDGSQAADRTDRLERWKAIVRGEAIPGDGPVALAWADTLTRYHIPRHYAVQLINGVARDLHPDRYETFDELSTYCYGVASTVGLMSMYIVGFQTADAIPYAIKLGVALQMTNILRDIGEDFRNGRVYLPREEMKAFGITEASLERGEVTGSWHELMAFEIERTRRLYAESRAGIAMLERDGQTAIAAAAALYEGILDAIEHNGYDVFTRRASLSVWQKLRRVPAVVLWPAGA
ncbi:MAG TPA: phytoene/squalene synthase family protein [Anaerolineales bacterium]